MGGGGVWRDVATHVHSDGKTYAYVGAQGNDGDKKSPELFVFDLSYLSGDSAHGNDEDPIPSAGYKREFIDSFISFSICSSEKNDCESSFNSWLNYFSDPFSILNINYQNNAELNGYTDLTHTLNVDRGLLFLNTASSSYGCRVYDLTSNPMSPKYLFNTAGSGKSCHDSSVRANVEGQDLFIVSDGGGRRQRIYDITDVSASWTEGEVPPMIGQTDQISGIYAHSNWLTEDNRYMFSWDENNVIDISVHDIVGSSSPGFSPKQIGVFQYSGEFSLGNAMPHNGQVRGQYLYVAYYKAGLRVFDISNVYAIVEVGTAETHRDANGDGNFEQSINSGGAGAWNVYSFLPSGNILVSDMYGGLFIVKPNPPYSAPSTPIVTADRDGSDNVVLTWNDVENARGYSVEYSSSSAGTYTVVAEHLTSTSFVDTSVRGQNAFYKIKAINGEGVGTSPIISQDGTAAPTQSMSPTNDPSATPSTSPSRSPAPTMSGGGIQLATYDSLLTAPKCDTYGSSCTSESLVNGRGTMTAGNEPNLRNALTDCPDGNSGSYHNDESIDKIVVRSGDIGDTSSERNMVEGDLATITASVYAWSTGSSDHADFYYASDASNPDWQLIRTVDPPKGGVNELSVSYTLPKGKNQAVRVNFRYNGSQSTCSGGSYDDTDDLGKLLL